MARSRVLADAGFAPADVDLRDGFLIRDWVPGTPMTRPIPPARIDAVADYVAFVGCAFRTEVPEDLDELVGMMRVNVAESLGGDWQAAVDRLASTAGTFDEPRTAIDGRLMPHEWIVTRDRPVKVVKVDALDHHADDFFPGCRDIAWDVAGAIVELDLHENAADRLVRRYEGQSGDGSIRDRLPLFAAAYLAYRVGYTTLAAETLCGTADGEAFTRARRRYLRSLAARLARHRRASAR